jgi:hypothetical protein
MLPVALVSWLITLMDLRASLREARRRGQIHEPHGNPRRKGD